MVNIMTVTNKDNKDNTGFLFYNTNKTNPKQPDLSGKAIIKGQEQQFVCWKNVSKDGKEYLTCKFSDPKPANESKPSANNNNDTNKPAYTSNISEDLDDLDAILRSAEEDNPFN